MIRYEWNIENFLKENDRDLITKLETAAILLKEIIKESMYKRQGGESSNPGETPAIQTESLRKSIVYRVDKKTLIAKVGIDDDKLKALSGELENYGYTLEIGSSTVSARPFIRPALQKSVSQIRDIFGD